MYSISDIPKLTGYAAFLSKVRFLSFATVVLLWLHVIHDIYLLNHMLIKGHHLQN